MNDPYQSPQAVSLPRSTESTGWGVTGLCAVGCIAFIALLGCAIYRIAGFAWFQPRIACVALATLTALTVFAIVRTRHRRWQLIFNCIVFVVCLGFGAIFLILSLINPMPAQS